MGKIKLYEIAKKFSLNSKDIVELAKKLKIEVKSHLSGIEEEQAKLIEEEIEKKNSIAVEISEKNSDKKVKKEQTPVIIRRELIVEEENKEIKEPKKEEKVKEKVGFLERKQNKDFNIVYRNKPSKPKTFSELFGTKKEGENSDNKKIISQETINKEEKDNKIEDNKKVVNNPEEKINTTKVSTEIKESQNEKTEMGVKVENKEVNNNSEKNKDNNIEKKLPNVDKTSYQERNKQNNFQPNRGTYNNNKNSFDKNNYNKNNARNNRFNSGYNSQNKNGQERPYDSNRPQRQYNNFNNNQDRYNSNGGNFQRRDGNQNKGYNNGYNGQNRRNNIQGNQYNNKGNGQRFNGNRPLDERGIEKNIKDIMSIENIEKEPVREYNKAIDKEKDKNKFDETRQSRKNSKSRKGEENNSINEHKLKRLKQTDKLSNMFDYEQEGNSMLDYYDLTTERGKKNKKKNQREDQNRNKQKIFQLTEISIPEAITVKDLATELKKTTAEVIKKLFGYGIMATINNEIDFDTAYLVAQEFGVTANKKETVTDEDILFDETEDNEEDLQVRPPVVVVMGHVDHGKTSLLDAVKKTNVIEGEAGGITQHIGAYKVKVNDREITFLDTPGHEAFTAMRARGAQITDIAILVVAANDGVMPQTVEAINHAKSAGIPIIVAINKIDLPDANVEKVKQELMQYELVPEEWGGDTIFVPISAKNNINIDQLLEMVLLQADMLELKANPNKQSKGIVIEARLDKGKGTVATMLVQRGTLNVGDTIIVGSSIGRIRNMVDDKGKKVKKAGPSTPVEVTGLTDIPEAGDTFYEVKDEKTAKHLIEKRKREAREKAINSSTPVTLDDLFSQIETGNLKTLNLIVKADVQGSVEAVKQSLEKLSNEEVKVKVIHAAAGAVTETDVTLAKVAQAIIIAFNVRPVPSAKDMAERESIQIKQYSVIYQAIDDVQSAMKGMLAPKLVEKVIGTAEIRQIFKVSNVGTIGGAYVLDGKLERNAGLRVIRENVVIFDGKLASLKRFKDDVKEVSKGFECGIQIEKYNDIIEGDILEAYVMEEVAR